jgi:hypothetical protein
VAGKNKVINGDFGVAQRGSTFTPPNNGGYNLDRWWLFYNGSGQTHAVSQQVTTPGSSPTGYEFPYFMRWQYTAAGSGNTFNNIYQRIENVQTLAGQTVTLSFWAKADASRSISANIYQNFGSGGSAEVYQSGTSFTATTSWQRFTYIVTLPSISGKTIGAGSYLAILISAPSGTTFTFDLIGVQLEAGSVATPFTTASGTLQGELALCQRYTTAVVPTGTASSYSKAGMGHASSSTQLYIYYQLPVVMRALPTSLTYSGLSNWSWTNQVGGGNPSSMAIDTGSSSGQFVVLSLAVSGATAGSVYVLQANNNPSAQIIISAEL